MEEMLFTCLHSDKTPHTMKVIALDPENYAIAKCDDCNKRRLYLYHKGQYLLMAMGDLSISNYTLFLQLVSSGLMPPKDEV